MKEHYIREKINSLFRVKQIEELPESKLDRQENKKQIIERMHDEIDRSCEELQYKLKRMLSLCMRTHI